MPGPRFDETSAGEGAGRLCSASDRAGQRKKRRARMLRIREVLQWATAKIDTMFQSIRARSPTPETASNRLTATWNCWLVIR